MTGREAALKSLGKYRRSNSLPEMSSEILGNESPNAFSDIALAMQIFNGVLQNMAYCDYIASYYSTIKLSKLQPIVLDILRISVYQLLFLTRIPRSAAVDESVKLAKKYANPRAAGYVNAILRKISDGAENKTIPEVTEDNMEQRLSIAFSHPKWLVEEFFKILGENDTIKLLGINNSMSTPTTIQVNTLLTDTSTVMSALEECGIEARAHHWLSDCIELTNPGKLNRLDIFNQGYFYVQDAASKLAILAAKPQQGDFVIDACASPGGKSFAAAISMGDKGRILACDLNSKRLLRINDGIFRLRINCIETTAKDARHKDSELIGKADLVIADVPCSNIGTIRKKPDIRYKNQNAIAALAEIQSSILSNLSTYVKPGGTLLYSTCTVLPAENQDIIYSFLEKHPEFSPAHYQLPFIGEVPDGMVTLWPHIHGTDGFFICKLVRNT